MYLCDAARDLDVYTTVLMSNAMESAAYTADACIVASFDDRSAIKQLIDESDVITFELEAVPEGTLKQLQEAVEAGAVRVNPGLDTLRLLQDKGLQKNWLVQQLLPTLPFVQATLGEKFLCERYPSLELPLVQKCCRGGYDGKGVQMIRSADDLRSVWPVDSIFEPLLRDRIEVSVIVARSVDGSMATYPAVSMEFDDRFNAVATVTSPAAVSPELQRSCEALANRAIASLEGVGVFAIEFFIAADDTIYFNEISPRVHNSGHLTMGGFIASQFEQHVRAIMGFPLSPIEKERESAVMRNILYDEMWGDRCPPKPCNRPVKQSLLSQVYWYGKSEGQAGRKMGHITTLGNSVATAYAESTKALASLREQPKEHNMHVQQHEA
jgi:5-(carboxyamino)imidazole ribonucleotide synthase